VDHNGAVGMRGIEAVNERAGNHHVRAEEFASHDLRAPAFQLVEMSAHIAHAQDAVGDEQRKRAVGLRDMQVHAPQSVNYVQAAGIHDLRAIRRVHFFRVSDMRDAIPLRDDSLAGAPVVSMTVTSVISSGFDASCLLCAAEATGMRQILHSAANSFTNSS
jgi:hypothetical protein